MEELKELLKWIEENKESQSYSESGENTVPEIEYIDYDLLINKIEKMISKTNN